MVRAENASLSGRLRDQELVLVSMRQRAAAAAAVARAVQGPAGHKRYNGEGEGAWGGMGMGGGCQTTKTGQEHQPLSELCTRMAELRYSLRQLLPEAVAANPIADVVLPPADASRLVAASSSFMLPPSATAAASPALLPSATATPSSDGQGRRCSDEYLWLLSTLTEMQLGVAHVRDALISQPRNRGGPVLHGRLAVAGGVSKQAVAGRPWQMISLSQLATLL